MAQALMIDAAQALDAPGWGGIPLYKLAEDYTEGPGKVALRYVARYLTAGATGKDATPLTAAEVDYLATQSASILPVWNLETGSSVSGTYADGQAAFAKCAAALAALGVPANAYPALDIEHGWALSPDWLLGWVDAARASIYGGASIIYCDDSTMGPVLTKAKAIGTQAQLDNLTRVLFWVAAWWWNGSGQPYAANGAAHGMTADALPAMDPATLFPAAPGQVVAWQYADGCVGGLCDQSVVDLGRVTAPGVLWAPKGPETQKTPAPTSNPTPSQTKEPSTNLPPGWVNDGGQAVTPGGLVFGELVQGVRVPGQYVFQFPVTLTGPKGTHSQDITLDTGDFELLVSPTVATALGLSQMQALTIEGVTGNEAAYTSQVNVTIGGMSWQNVNCIVAGSQAGMLFGLRFFMNRQVGLRIDPTTFTLELYQAP
jgi:hypothetical protein